MLGSSSFGQLGDGSTTRRTRPRQVGTGTDWVSVDLGFSHSCGIRGNGTLWCWGSDVDGDLGNGFVPGSVTTPSQVGTLITWQVVAVGDSHTCATRTSGCRPQGW